jgi:hypothetical protein
MLSALHTWTLTAIAFAAGVAMLWVFAGCSDQAHIELAKRKLRAHLLAFRLFSDEPRLIFRSQKQLLIWNARYLALMLRPTLVMILPLAALLWHLDAIYGHRPLAPGETAIVTLQLAPGEDALRTLYSRQIYSLTGEGVTVETPALRLPDMRQVLWRVRVAGPPPAEGPRGVTVWRYDFGVPKTVQVGGGLQYLSKRLVTSRFDWLLYPAEPRLFDCPQYEGIEVEYPYADVSVFGIGMHWLIWFCIVNLFTMLALRKRFGVTF